MKRRQQTELLTANAIADLLGMDRRSVTLRLGGVPPSGRKNGRDAWTLQTFWRASEARSTATAARTTKDNAGGTYATERTKWLRERRRLAELDRKKAEGRVIDVDAAIGIFTKMVGVVKMRLLAIPAKFAPRAALFKNAGEFECALYDEIWRALEELAQAPCLGSAEETSDDSELSDDSEDEESSRVLRGKA